MKKTDTEGLAFFRTKIDRIDKELISLMAERFSVTKQVGEYKRIHAMTGRDPAREASQIARLQKLAVANGLDPEFIERIFRMLFDKVVSDHAMIAKEKFSTGKRA